MKKIKVRANQPLLLLPSKFKNISWVIFLLLLLVMLFYKINSAPSPNSSMKYIAPWLKSLLLISFFIPGVCREKNEDERLAQLRSRILAGSFSLAVMFAALLPIINLHFSNFMSEMDIYGFMLIQLGLYHGSFFALKNAEI